MGSLGVTRGAGVGVLAVVVPSSAGRTFRGRPRGRFIGASADGVSVFAPPPAGGRTFRGRPRGRFTGASDPAAAGPAGAEASR